MKIVMIGALAFLTGLGCDRTHMSPQFGTANRNAYRAQVISPDAGAEATADPPLDPEEAATISKGYRRSLAPPHSDDTGAGRNQLLVVPSGPPGAAMLPTGYEGR